MREARLRPEYAHLYPGLTSGQWESAARIAEAVLANLMLRQLTEASSEERVLTEEHFEFRGAGGNPGVPRRRLGDGSLPGQS